MQDNGLSCTRGQWLVALRWWPCAIVVILFSVSNKLVQKTSKENSRCMFRGSWWWKPRQRKEETVRTSKKEPQESYIIQRNWLNICCRHFFLFIRVTDSSEFLLNSSSESSGSLSDDSDDWEWASSDDVFKNTWPTFCMCGNYAVTRYLPILICCLTFHSCHDHISRLWVNASCVVAYWTEYWILSLKELLTVNYST